MSELFVSAGAALLVYCLIWAYTWLEVWNDPKDDLKDFYLRNPRTEGWVSLANRLWLPILTTGLIFVVIGLLTGEK